MRSYPQVLGIWAYMYLSGCHQLSTTRVHSPKEYGKGMSEPMAMALLFCFYVFIIMEYLGNIKQTVKSKINKALGICSLKEERPTSALAFFLPPEQMWYPRLERECSHYLGAAFPPQQYFI